MDSIKRSELMHFSHVESRNDVLILDSVKRAEVVENALTLLYRLKAKSDRDELLGLVQTIMQDDAEISKLFTETSYVVCNKHLVITLVNDHFLNRSGVERFEILGKSLYFERAYEGTQIEQLYSMVMETRLMADALVRYSWQSVGGKIFDGYFIIVVIPLEEGGIGVLSRFTRDKSDVVEIDPTAPDGPIYIDLNS
ncbi:MAG: hypothetical protein Q8922_16110 [Bacteroidota bacterium]|nr:hypothetical protein [Bacteroidota bacterium]MDP4234814.1 hypothetical protein [Bacteroidota bacterium]MDP4244202.1 hypothetical protein [Bacteroidota bacterium]MDP4289439.1 hypothetical protein [Bacteroidota bacterium]